MILIIPNRTKKIRVSCFYTVLNDFSRREIYVEEMKFIQSHKSINLRSC